MCNLIKKVIEFPNGLKSGGFFFEANRGDWAHWFTWEVFN
jgi:hypothetical protein